MNVFAIGSSYSVKVRNSCDDLGAAVLYSVVNCSQPVGCALACVVEVSLVRSEYDFWHGCRLFDVRIAMPQLCVGL